jgi:hypothetical protein
MSFFVTVETFPFEWFGHFGLIGLGIPLVPSVIGLTPPYVHGYFGVIKPSWGIRGVVLLCIGGTLTIILSLLASVLPVALGLVSLRAGLPICVVRGVFLSV